MLLPPVSCLDEYRSLRGGGDLLPAAREICRRHSLACSDLRMEGSGTHLVFLLPESVIKVFSPLWSEDFKAECESLTVLGGGPFPGILFEGTLDGWPYIVMTRIGGMPARVIWPYLPTEDRCRLLEDLGCLIRDLHRHLPPPGISNGWEDFVHDRIEDLDIHNGLTPGPWRDWVHARIESRPVDPFEPVLLHADITWDHVFVERNGRGWRISGLIDFGDSMGGHPMYELGAPLLFLCFGEPGLTARLLAGAGCGNDRETAGRILACTMLHRYGRLGQWLEKVPVPDGGSLEEALFGFRL